jgi:hypothetical protein
MYTNSFFPRQDLRKDEKACLCRPDCEKLWDHIKILWPSCCIEKVQSISNPQDDPKVSSQILSWALHEGYFDNQKNDLCVKFQAVPMSW